VDCWKKSEIDLTSDDVKYIITDLLHAGWGRSLNVESKEGLCIGCAKVKPPIFRINC
jgi:hypothetical protein